MNILPVVVVIALGPKQAFKSIPISCEPSYNKAECFLDIEVSIDFDFQ